MDYCVRASTRDSPLQRPVTWMLGNRRACEENRRWQQAAFGPDARAWRTCDESSDARNIGEGDREPDSEGVIAAGVAIVHPRPGSCGRVGRVGSSYRLSSDASLVSCVRKSGSVARLGRRGERNEWRHCKKLCQPAHRSYTSVRRPPSTILRMRGARPPPGLPPGGEAATGAPPALASPGRSREAATVRTHAYPNRQVDRQGREGGRAPAGHANKQPAGRPQPEPDPYSPSQQTWPALIRCREAARRWSSLSW